MLQRLYNNTLSLTRFILRRDRIRIPIWLISLLLITIVVAISFTDLYPTKEERDFIAETMRNPAMIAMIGKGYGLNNYTHGAMMAHQMLLITAVVVALMSIFFVARHTRADEESGRIEMIRSLPVGRLSNINSTIIVACCMNILLALVIGMSLIALGIESMDLNGSLLYGAALGGTGIFFSAVAGVFAQFSESSRGTIGLSVIVLGVAYLIRAIGDVGNQTLSLFSPLGWILSTEVYVNNYWWPISLTVGSTLFIIALAHFLNSKRDLETGFFPAKPGNKYASSFLKSPLGLAIRLQRSGIIAWGIGIFVIGASYGSVIGDLESFFKSMDIMENLLIPGFTLTEQFLTMSMPIMAMLCTIPAIQAMLKLIGEERVNLTEHILSRAVSRVRLMSGYVLISITVSFLMLSLAAIGFWSVGIMVMDESISFFTFYNASLVYLPATLFMVSIAVLIIGLAPKITNFIWFYVMFSFSIVFLKDLLQLPDWLSKLSPYDYIPQLPIEDMDFGKLSIMFCVTIFITIIGYIGYKTRDIYG